MPYLSIVRPLNCLFVIFTVLIGAMLGNTVNNLSAVIFACLAASFIAAGGYAVNDFFDLRTDLVNKPGRVLPKGLMKSETAFLYATFLFTLGISLSFFTADYLLVILAILNSFLLFYYAKTIKDRLIISNILVSFLAGSTFLYGGIANSNFGNTILISGYTFIYTMIREIVKDMEDVRGDLRVERRSIPIVFGLRKSMQAINLLGLFLLFSLIFTFITGLEDQSFLIILTVLWVIPFGFFCYRMVSGKKPETYRKISHFIKIHMFILMIVFFLLY